MRFWFPSRVRGFARIALAVAVAAAASACGQEEAQAPPAAAPTAPSGAPAQASGSEPAPLAAESAPDAPPLEFDFVYPGSEEGEARGLSDPSQFGKVYYTDDDANLVASFFKQALDGDGWTLMDDRDEGLIAVQIFSREDQMATLFYMRREEGGTQILVAVTKGMHPDVL